MKKEFKVSWVPQRG